MLHGSPHKDTLTKTETLCPHFPRSLSMPQCTLHCQLGDKTLLQFQFEWGCFNASSQLKERAVFTSNPSSRCLASRAVAFEMRLWKSLVLNLRSSDPHFGPLSHSLCQRTSVGVRKGQQRFCRDIRARPQKSDATTDKFTDTTNFHQTSLCFRLKKTCLHKNLTSAAF